MRNTTITSSIASVVRPVADALTVAGIAAHSFLHLTFLREHMGYWLELCQSGFDYVGGKHRRLGNPQPGGRPGMQRRLGISQLAVCPAPSRLASVKENLPG